MKREAGGPRIARLLLFCLLAAPAPAAAAPVDDALSAAREKSLWNDSRWLTLGHYKRARWSGRLESDAMSGFFLAPDGRTNPRAELEALIVGLYASDPGKGEHASCRFPARTAWAVEALTLDRKDLTRADCSKYEDWRRLMDAGSVSLIFASAYMANPSSMFGHTFLRIGRSSTGGDPLRDNTLNFAANTNEDGGANFIYKGLMGLYPGIYTVMPYYMKVAEYNGIENRDLWEYELNLSSTEVDRLAAHAWEMGDAKFPYFFFSKNCSYQLMPVLEAAAPRLTLMPGSPAIVGPADTIMTVSAIPGLVKNVRYRPSQATSMLQRRRLLNSAERASAWAYANGQIEEGDRLSASLPNDRRALALDSAEDFILYKKGSAPDAPPEVRALERPILLRRAHLDAKSIEPETPAWAVPPEQGHSRQRVMFGEGARKGGSFSEISWRPGYHDLLDSPRGYVPGAAIEGLSARIRYDRDEKRFYVRDARLVEILSATPWDSWTRKPTWSVGTGLDTAFELGREASRSLVYEGHAGGGFSTRPWGNMLAFGLIQAETAVGSPLRDGYRAGGGVRAGVALDLGMDWRALVDGHLGASMVGDKTPDHHVRVGLNWSPRRDFSLRAEGLARGPHREAGLYAAVYY